MGVYDRDYMRSPIELGNGRTVPLIIVAIILGCGLLAWWNRGSYSNPYADLAAMKPKLHPAKQFELGKFTIDSGEILITDPSLERSYAENGRSRRLEKVAKGEWQAYSTLVTIQYYETSQTYNGELTAHLASEPLPASPAWEQLPPEKPAFFVPQQVGLFDAASFGKAEGKDSAPQSWFHCCQQAVTGDARAGVLPHGAVSHSINGGLQKVFVLRNAAGEITAIRVTLVAPEDLGFGADGEFGPGYDPYSAYDSGDEE